MRYRCSIVTLVAVLVLTVAQGVASAAIVPSGWTLVGHGVRSGSLYRGSVPGAGAADLYLPHGNVDHPLPIVYIDGDRAPATLAGETGIENLADQLTWDGTAPSFAALILDTPAVTIARTVAPWVRASLPIARRSPATLVGLDAEAGPVLGEALAHPNLAGTIAEVGGTPSAALARTDARLLRRQMPALERDHLRVFTAASSSQSEVAASRTRQLDGEMRALALPHRSIVVRSAGSASALRRELGLALPYALTPVSTQHAAAGAAGILPKTWTQVLSGPDGGTVWQGPIPNTVVSGVHRDALVYLPPNIDRTLHYPVVYLMHGLRGSPYSFIGGLRFAATADDLITRGHVRPFIAVMPPAGRTIAYDGEWTGPWERYVVDDVVPWTHAHLPAITAPAPGGSTLAGFSAGGYGALDIGFRHPGLFHTLESWSGYYTAPHDGSLTGASAAELAAHDPTRLARVEAATLRSDGTRVFVSLGRQEQHVQAPAHHFAGLLAALGISHRLVIVPGHHNGKTWRGQMSAALEYALAPNRIRPALVRRPRLDRLASHVDVAPAV